MSFRRFEIACLIGFLPFWGTLVARTWHVLTSHAVVLAIALGFAAADLVSGVSHWTFDTWFSETTPVVGRAFVRTFREHHVDPTAICRHDFVETNGSNALAGAIFVVVGHAVSFLSASLGAALVVTSVLLSVTSQIHKWAHGATAPRVVTWLQRHGVILSPTAHAAHHAGEHDRSYCITLGWLNRPLEQIGFFRGLEGVISAVSGAVPSRASLAQVHGDARVVMAAAE